jgi:hypothetical protein
VITLLAKPQIQRMVRKGDSLFSIISVSVLIILLTITIYWFIQPPPLNRIANMEIIDGTPGQSIKLGTAYTVTFNTKKAIYHMWIENARGEVIYNYPSAYIENKDSFTFGNQTVVLPEDLPAGDYFLKAQLQYALNPIKVAEVQAILAKLDVQKE